MGWIEGKVALVTGAAAGLGRGFAEALAAEGAALALCDVQPEVARVAASLMEQYGIAASVYVADVGDPTDAWRVVDETVASLGGVDILVNNAGIWVPTDPTAARRVGRHLRPAFDVNTRGVFLLGRAVMPLMLGREGGHIVNIVTDHVYTEPASADGRRAHGRLRRVEVGRQRSDVRLGSGLGGPHPRQRPVHGGHRFVMLRSWVGGRHRG